jgi:serine/threonine-protein kinase
MAELRAGSEFAGYRIEEEIGQGGMGVVYRAVELALDRVVALKLISQEAARDPVFLERFAHESRIAARVEHPNVVPIYATGEEDGTPFIAMRYVPGPDLGRKIALLRRLEAEDAASLIAQVASGLDALHAAGLVHRDVKASNVLLSGEEGRELAYLTDFGLAKHVASASELTRGGLVMGSLDYVAPEQVRGLAVDAHADVYALGAVLYKALTGEVPFPREDGTAKMWAHVNEEAPPPSETAGVPPAFDPVVARALAKRPQDRFPSAGDLGRAALAAAGGEPVTEPERRVATGEAATPTMVRGLEEGEGTTAELARRYAREAARRRRQQVRTGWRSRVPSLLLIGAAIAAGVGASILLADDGADEPSPALRFLIGRADEICAESRGRYQPVAARRPATPDGIARQYDELAAISQDALVLLRGLSPAPPEVRGRWQDYLRLRRRSVNYLRAARDAAEDRNQLSFDQALRRNAAEGPRRFAAARDVGLEQCSRGA